MIPRAITPKLRTLAEGFPVLTLTGPRQAGKTTLVRDSFPNHDYANLEFPDIRAFAERDPRGFLGSLKGGAILDEIQHVPGLLSYIQGLVDESGEMGRFVLTGSGNLLRLEKLSQSLAGRTAVVHLLPFSLKELLDAGLDRGSWEEWAFRGFYPPLYDRTVPPEEWLASYVETYLERDVRAVTNVHNLSLFRDFMRLCAGRVGQILNAASLGNDLGVDQKTVTAWLSVLEATFTTFTLRPYYRNFNKRIVKSPKLYFHDTGLVCYLMGIRSPEQLQTHHARGSLFENMMLAELHKNAAAMGRRASLYFWRDRTGREIDCIWEHAGKTRGMELKSGKTVADDFFTTLNYLRSLAGNHWDQSYIVYGGESPQSRTTAEVLPWYDIAGFSVE